MTLPGPLGASSGDSKLVTPALDPLGASEPASGLLCGHRIPVRSSTPPGHPGALLANTEARRLAEGAHLTLLAWEACACDQPWARCEGCGGAVIFAPTAEAALAILIRADLFDGPPDMTMLRRNAEADPLRRYWTGRPMTPPGRPSYDLAVLWRDAGWGEPGECLECGKTEWEEIPESVRCDDCGFCRECGCEDDCE